MEINNKFNSMSNTPDLHTAVHTAINSNIQNLNCMRIGIVQEFYPEDLTVSVLIANKKEEKLNFNGTQNVRNYALIRAKVCYCNPFETFPINAGDECILLFSDREIESWFINGEVNPIAYPRMHDLTDAVAIFGIRSLPKMIEIATNCLHLFYASNSIKIGENDITATNFKAMNGASQTDEGTTFVSQDGKTITVKYGIITGIVE